MELCLPTYVLGLVLIFARSHAEVLIQIFLFFFSQHFLFKCFALNFIRIIIIIDNFCIVLFSGVPKSIALFSGVPKLTALYNILQHFLSFTNAIHIIMTTNNVGVLGCQNTRILEYTSVGLQGYWRTEKHVGYWNVKILGCGSTKTQCWVGGALGCRNTDMLGYWNVVTLGYGGTGCSSMMQWQWQQ